MNFSLPIEGGVKQFYIESGESIIFVGANGSGKSRLAIEIEKTIGGDAHRISAHRALNLNPNVSKISEENALRILRFGTNVENAHVGHRRGSRWGSKENTFLLNDFDSVIQALFANQANVSLESHRILRGGLDKEAPQTKFEMLIDIWSSILPHRELVIDGDSIKVRVAGEVASYNASDMSDGERAVFYLIGQVLVAKENSLLIIDEPELHIHRSIMSALWDQLEGCRKDCAFIFITHDLDFASSRVAEKFAIKGFKSIGPQWELDEISDEEGFPEEIATLILGSRKPILFVEGQGSSLDKALYRSVYPQWTIVTMGSCKDVIHAVSTLNKNSHLTRYKCSGIVDSDGYELSDIEYLRSISIYVLPVSEIENIFLLPTVSYQIALTENLGGTEIEKILDDLTTETIKLISEPRILSETINRYCCRRIDRYLKNLDFSGCKNISDIKVKYEQDSGG